MNTETAAPPPAILNGNTLAIIQPAANPLVMPVSPRFVADRYNAIQEIQKEIFKEDVHFGAIPGTGPKKTLLKPGADALCTAFQLSPDFLKQPESVERADHVHLVYKCVLTSASGRVLATGVGSCNSKEEKYRWVNTARVCPSCKKETIIKGKAEYGGGYVCFAKKGGCGAKFKDGDQSIEGQAVGRIENDNAWNFHNTITKMAQKRALVAATITACGISGEFTQDVEDFDPPNDKSKRDEPLVDIQANHAPERPYYQEDEYASFSPANPQSLPDSIPDFTPVDPAFPADILKARESVLKELAHCKTKEDFQRLKPHMQASGAAHLDARVTILVNEAYAKTFPAKSKGAQS